MVWTVGGERVAMTRKAMVILGDGAVYLGVGATLGALAVLAGAAETPWAAWALAAAAVVAGVLLRGRVGQAAVRAVEAAFAAGGAPLSAVRAERPLSLLGVAAGLGGAAWALGLSGAAGFVVTAGAATAAVAGVFWAAARLAGPLLKALAGDAALFGQGSEAISERAVQVALAAVGAAAVLEIWGAPVAMAAIAVALVGAVAARGLLRDLFSSALLRSQNRVRIGDAIEIAPIGGGGIVGTVAAIDARSITIQRADGALITAPPSIFFDHPTVIRSGPEQDASEPASPEAAQTAEEPSPELVRAAETAQNTSATSAGAASETVAPMVNGKRRAGHQSGASPESAAATSET